MLDSYLTTFKKYFQFSGRATRGEFWTFTLLNTVIFIILGILGLVLGSVSSSLASLIGLIYGLFSLASLLPSLSVLIRRLHDTGRSGWWFFIALIPLVGFIILLVFLLSGSKK